MWKLDKHGSITQMVQGGRSTIASLCSCHNSISMSFIEKLNCSHKYPLTRRLSDLPETWQGGSVTCLKPDKVPLRLTLNETRSLSNLPKIQQVVFLICLKLEEPLWISLILTRSFSVLHQIGQEDSMTWMNLDKQTLRNARTKKAFWVNKKTL